MSGSTLIVGKTPNWFDGYVPSAAEWNAWWAMKLDASDAFITQGPYLRLAGGTMTGRLTLAVAPVNPLDAVTKAYVDGSSLAGGPYLALAGGSMAGRLTLVGPPVSDNEAATKAYVDAGGGGGTGGPFLPLTGGTLLGPLILAADPTQPLSAATKAYVDNATPIGGPFLPLVGGTLSGPLMLAADPAVPLAAATKAYVDAHSGGGILEAPTDGATYGRNNAVWNKVLPLTGGALTGSLSTTSTWIQQGTHTMTSGVAPGPGGLSPMQQYVVLNWAGTIDTGGNPHLGLWNIYDTVNADRAQTMSQLLAVSQQYNAGANSDRIQASYTFNKNAAASDGLYTQVYNLWCSMHGDAWESTTAGNYLGRATCVNFDARIGGTGYYVSALNVQENDIRLYAGNQVLRKTNIGLHCGIGDAGHGIDDDAALIFTRSPTVPDGTGGHINLIQAGGALCSWPLDPTLPNTSFFSIGQNNPNGRYSNLTQPWIPNVGVGFDLYGARPTTATFRTAGLTIDGKGQLSVLGPGAVTYGTTGIKISAPNLRTVSASIANGGDRYRVGDYVVDPIGGLWRVATIVSGTLGPVTSVTLDTPGYAGLAPTNPVSTRGGNGIGLTLNLITAATGALNLGDTGQTLGFNGSTAIAKPTITGDRGGVASLGSLLNQLANYGLITDATTAGTPAVGGVTSFNTRTGAVTLVSADVTGALGYTPYDSANPVGYQTAAQITTALAPYYLSANPAGYQTAAQVTTAVDSSTANYVPLTQRAAPNGVATLDGTGVVPIAQLPGAVTGTLTYLGAWNASTNTPVLASGALSGGVLQTAGRYYVVSVTGTTSLDGVATWTAGDWVSSNGTVWQRVQNSTSPYLPLTGGTLSGAVTLSGDTWQPAIEPDIPWSLRGTGGNIPVMLDQTGVLSVASLVAPAANITTLTGVTALTGVTTLGATTAIFTTATIASEQIADQAMPDLIGAVAGSNGNVVSGYDSITGEFNVAALSVSGGIKIAGNQLTLSKAPNDAVDVTVAPYNAKGDGMESFCYGTISTTSLTISNYTGNITLTQKDPATATLVITPVYNSGIAFQGYDVGRTLYLVAGSYTLQAVVTRFWDATTVDLAAASVTPQSAVAATVTWPSFLASDIGKYMIIDGAGQFQMYTNAVTRTGDPSPYAIPFITTIAAVVSPTQVTLTAAPPVTPWSNKPTRLRWGSNDNAAVVAAGQAAYAQQKRKIYFPGDGSLYLLLGMCATSLALPNSYGLTYTTEAAAAVNGLLWLGDNARAFACDTGGQPMPQTIAQVGSDTGKTVPKKFFGRASFPRCSKLQTINLLIMGDSQSVYGPQNQFQAVGQAHHFAYYFRQANPGKTINIYNTGIGGSTFESIDANPVVTNTNLPAIDGWVVPRPIAGTTSLMAFVANVNRTATSATNPIVPDCVAILDNGGNDGQGISVAAMRSVINQILAVPHADGNGPTDVVMMTDNLAVMGVSTSGNGLGTALPAVAPGRWGDDYAAGIIRTMAASSGYGCIDLAGAVQRTCYGMDETTRRLRVTPQWTVTGSPAAPIVLPHRTVNYSFQWAPTAASDAAAWTAMQEMRFGLSQQIGNDAIIRLGPNNHLWTASETSGMRVPTTCTIGTGSTSLTVAAPTTFSGITFSTKNPTPIIYVSSGAIFTAGMVPSMITIPTGTGNRTQRDFIRQFIDGSNVMRLFNNYGNGEAVNQAGTITVGGAHFYANDGTSCPDVVIFYPDGTIFQTKVAYGGYVSQTQVTLADPAPQALAGVTVPVFIGRMGKRWTDSGFDLTARTTGVGTYSVDVQRDAVLFSYGAPGKTLEAPIIGNLTGVERYGGSYHPVIVPTNSQEIAMKSIYIDSHRPFLPSATPWEIRGQNAAPSQSYWMGGVSGHPASPIMSDIQIPFYANQDLGTV